MALLFALLGLLVGAVANQLGADLAARRKPTRPHCPYCGRARPWWAWRGVTALLWRRGTCQSCDARLKPLRPLVELGLAVAYAYLWLAFGLEIRLPIYAVYLAILALILVTDIERRLILNVVTYPAIALAALAALVTPSMTWWSALLGGAIGFAFFFVAALVGNALFGSGAMGGGDVKLAALVGLMVGFPLIVEALLVTLISGALVSVLLLVTRLRKLRDPIPYGPFLVAGAVVALLWGYPLAAWLLR
jgi:leader peptidase (prepilin peptidase) / N-methyltransferase